MQVTFEEGNEITLVPFSTMVQFMGRAMPSSVEQAQISRVVEAWATGGTPDGREAGWVVRCVPDTLFAYLTEMLIIG